jgi:hypothetical protein
MPLVDLEARRALAELPPDFADRHQTLRQSEYHGEGVGQVAAQATERVAKIKETPLLFRRVSDSRLYS